VDGYCFGFPVTVIAKLAITVLSVREKISFAGPYASIVMIFNLSEI
jgi:hypothetical protein